MLRGGEHRRGDDDAWDADQLVHCVRGEIAELLEVEAGPDGDLHLGDGLRSGLRAFLVAIRERKEDSARGSCDCILKLRHCKYKRLK